MDDETIEALASGEPSPTPPLYCTECDTHLYARDIQDGRCGCGSGRVVTLADYVADLQNRNDSR